MKESVQGFERRTGLRYAPPATLAAAAHALARRESCPTLFRYPGPQGLAQLIGGTLRELSPPGTSWIWLHEKTPPERRLSAQRFGLLAILQPLRLSPVREGKGVWLARAHAVPPDEPLVWVPPSAVKRPVSLDRVNQPEQAVSRFGPSYEAQRRQVTEQLDAYLEELSLLEQAGVEPPRKPWCELSAATRKRKLAQAGVKARWTREFGS